MIMINDHDDHDFGIVEYATKDCKSNIKKSQSGNQLHPSDGIKIVSKTVA